MGKYENSCILVKHESVQGVVGEYGLLVVEPNQENIPSQSFCLLYYPDLVQIPENKSVAEKFQLSSILVR